MKTYTQYEIYAIIDKMIKEEMRLKNEYIKKNGYKHKDTLDRFDSHICALSGMYSAFKE